MTVIPIPGLLIQQVLLPAAYLEMPSVGDAGECSDSESGSSHWASVWSDADPLEILAESQPGKATAAEGVQEADPEEGDDELRIALAALLTLSIPVPAEKPPLFSQPCEMPGREGALTMPEETLCGNGRIVNLPPSSTFEVESGARPSGAQWPETNDAVAEPLPAAPSVQPGRLAAQAPSPGAQQDSRVFSSEPRPEPLAEPVADVVLRPAARQAGLENRAHEVPADIDGASTKAPETGSEPPWMPPHADDRSSMPRGLPDRPTNRQSRSAGGNGLAAALRLTGDEAGISESELPLSGEGLKTSAARPAVREADRKEGAQYGRPEAEQQRPVHQDAPEQAAPHQELTQRGGLASLSSGTALAGTARSAAGSEPFESISPQQLAEPEPPQEAARLNGQLDLQIDGQRGERVRIRFAEAPGGVRMRVASNDARLAESLRAEWQTLEAALRRSGWDPQPGSADSADAAVEGLTRTDGRANGPGSAADGGDRRALAQEVEQGQRQAAQQGSRQDARQQEQNETRQEWLDLSALRRMGRRRQA